MISPDLAFLLIAGLAFLGFVLDALFDRVRVTSVLPLMLVGIALLYFHVLPTGTITGLDSLVPILSALTIAFILFHVGLDIRFEELSHVFRRTMAFTLVVQVTTGVAISLLALYTFHWGLLLSFVFGFGLSGPSSISVPVLVRIARMPESLGTSLLFESVVTDLLQLLVPLVLIGLVVSGNFSTVHIGTVLALTIVGSIVTGLVAAILWLWVLERIGPIAREYSWTLTITMVFATYGISDYIGMSAAITIFVFGLMIGNRKYLEFDAFSHRHPERTRSGRTVSSLRRALHLSAKGVDVEHIQQVQKEVSFFASAFFFVYIGLLFQVGDLTELVLLVPLIATFVMLALRYLGSPILAVYFSKEARARRSERSLISFNIPRGLAAAIIATVPLSAPYNLVIPGFLDAMFLGILYSTIVSTVGIFLFYEGTPTTEEAEETDRPGVPSVAAFRETAAATEFRHTGSATLLRSPPATTPAPSSPSTPPPLPRPRSPPKTS